MNKKFRCGRLMLSENQTLKKLDLENGGGSRSCQWNKKDMTFTEVHYILLEVFKLDDTELETSLYDFELKPLNTSQYQTFDQYINHNGLNLNSTIIYLCTNEIHASRTSTSTHTTSSSAISTEHKNINIEQDFNQQQIHHSSSGYSFVYAINDIIKHIHYLINKNIFDETLINVFENIYMIHGYVNLSIDSLKHKMEQSNQHIQLINQSDVNLHSNILNNTYDICQSTHTLLNMIKNKYDHTEHYLIIVDSFNQFYQNLKILHKQWFECIETNNKSHEVSSSFIIHSMEPVTSTSSDLNIEMISTENQEIYLLSYARDLLNAMYGSRLSTFRIMVKSIIVEIESIQSNINVYNFESLHNARNVMISVKTRYTKKFKPDAFTSPVYQITRPVKQAYQKTLTAICDLITFVTNNQMQAIEDHKKNSNQSSTSLSITGRKQWKNKQPNRSHKRKLENLHTDNHSQNEISSYSSSEHASLPQYIDKENKRKFYKSN
ncbi:unnamed protein product [Rotaria sp. Silwood1]|nr:unnamed protein product [Rotaria sp. Silwood1]